MLRQNEIMQTLDMIDHQHLDIRTITMGISLRDCCGPDPKRTAQKIYDKITHCAQQLVPTGEAIEREFGIPIVNKRISVTPISMVAESCETEDYVPFAVAMDKAAAACGVNRRLFRTGTQGNDHWRSAADHVHSAGTGGDQ